jgi:hypothetical protein
MRSPLGIIVLVILVIILLGGVAGPRVNPSWQYGYGYGVPGIGGLGGVLVIFLILWLLGYV